MAFVIRVEDLEFGFQGFGSENLPLTDETEIVLRKSEFISPRTLAIQCDAAAIDVPREMVNLLKDPGTIGSLEIKVIEALGLSEREIPPIEFVQ